MAILGALLLRVEQWLFGRLPANVRFNTRLELIAALAYGVFFAGTLGFLPVILRRLGADTNQLALYVTLTYAGSLLAPVSVALTRGKKPIDVAVVCWSLGRGVFALGLFVTQSWALLVIAGIFWILESIPVPAYSQIMQRIYPPAFRGRAMSGVRIGMTLAVLLITPIFGLLLDSIGHQWLLITAALFGVISSAIFAPVRPIYAAATSPRPVSIGSVLGLLKEDRRFAFYLLVMTIYGFGGVMALPLFPIVQVSRLQLSYTQIGTLGLLQSLFWLVGFLFWGRLLDKHGAVWVLRVAMMLAAIVPFTYMWATNIWMLLPAFIAQGLLQGAFELGATNTAIELANEGRVMEYSALQTAVIGLRGMIAPFIAASLVNSGVLDVYVFGLCVILILIGVLLMGRVKQSVRLRPT
ncbi:MAG: hypothetical protein Fur005_04930 [Roseiflexaceae bacterium]